jgi:hypothetical protein
MKRITYDDFLDVIQTFSQQKDWDGLEAYFNQYCAQFVSADAANNIKQVNLAECERYLSTKTNEAVLLAKDHNAKSIYYEYNIQNDWASNFYIFSSYNSIKEQDDDWAAGFLAIDKIKGFEPAAENIPELSGFLYACEGVEERIVVEYYLIARTTAAFGRATEALDLGNIALCAGFHDQQIVTRIYEPLSINVEE